MFGRTTYKNQIKESIDNLPTGIIFAKKNGIILLANKKMYDIYYLITGEVLQSALSFWKSLDTDNEHIEVIEHGDTPCLRVDGKSVYNFSKNIVNMNGMEVLRIDAVDITKLYELRLELLEKKKDIEKIRKKMVDTMYSLEKITSEEEIIDAKMKVHRTMGEGLASVRHYLLTGDGDILKSLNTWKSSLKLLDKDDGFIRQGHIESLKNAGRALGIDIHILGDFPSSKKAAKVIIWVAKECLINSAIHADAKNMYITIEETGDDFVISFANDGRKLEKNIRPGGGFASIRKVVVDFGGSFEYTTRDDFVLTVYLPR